MLAGQKVPGEVDYDACLGDPQRQEEAPEVVLDDGGVLEPHDDDIPGEKSFNSNRGTT